MNRPKAYWRPPKVDPFAGKMSVRGRVILGVILFILLMFFGVIAYMGRFLTKKFVIRQDQPLTYQEMIKKGEFHFPLPSSSEDIYYGEYTEWQAYTCVVRFKAPVKDCLEEIDKVIALDSRSDGRTNFYPRVNIVGVGRPRTGCFDSVAWFTPETISRGIYTGKDGSHTPQIWVDLDRGIFYFLETD